MSRSVLAGIIGLLAGLSASPAVAGGFYDECDYEPTGYYAVYAPRYYDYEPRVLAYYSDPRSRWDVATYYNAPPRRLYRPYGYAHVSRGPAVLVHRHEPWWRRW